MDVLAVLARRAPRTVARDELIRDVWGHPHVTDGVVTRCISLLRQRLHDDRDDPRFIATLAKRGYRLMQPVAYVDDALPARAATKPAASGSVVVAVLPFVNLSGSSADEHVADALTELVTASLAGGVALRVISRTSSMVYKHARKRLATIAAELGATHVVEGSLLHGDGRLQIVVQLIQASNDIHLLSRTYTREPGPLLRVLNEIAASVAHELRMTLSRDDALPFARPAMPSGKRRTNLRRPSLLPQPLRRGG